MVRNIEELKKIIEKQRFRSIYKKISAKHHFHAVVVTELAEILKTDENTILDLIEVYINRKKTVLEELIQKYSKEYLENLYKNYSKEEIAKQLNTNVPALLKVFKHYGIKTKKNITKAPAVEAVLKKYTREELTTLYKSMTMKELAEYTGSTLSTMRNVLLRIGLINTLKPKCMTYKDLQRKYSKKEIINFVNNAGTKLEIMKHYGINEKLLNKIFKESCVNFKEKNRVDLILEQFYDDEIRECFKTMNKTQLKQKFGCSDDVLEQIRKILNITGYYETKTLTEILAEKYPKEYNEELREKMSFDEMIKHLKINKSQAYALMHYHKLPMKNVHIVPLLKQIYTKEYIKEMLTMYTSKELAKKLNMRISIFYKLKRAHGLTKSRKSIS